MLPFLDLPFCFLPFRDSLPLLVLVPFSRCLLKIILPLFYFPSLLKFLLHLLFWFSLLPAQSYPLFFQSISIAYFESLVEVVAILVWLVNPSKYVHKSYKLDNSHVLDHRISFKSAPHYYVSDILYSIRS